MRTPPGITTAASVLLALSVAALLASCTADTTEPSPAIQPSTSVLSTTAVPGTTAVPSSAKGAPPTVVSPTKVLTFVEENHSLAQMQAGMPYLAGLAEQYAYATDFTAISHPSLPNYLAIAGGSTFGVTDDNDPSVNAAKVGTASSVFDQALARGDTAKTYAESMPSNCALTSSSGLYAVRHNPWTYFDAGRAGCNTFDVPAGTPTSGALASDIATGSLPDVGLVVPNLCNDAHDCSLTIADRWLKGWLPAILTSPDFTSGRLAVVVTADEDDESSGNTVLTVVLHAKSPGGVVTAHLTHYSLSRLYSQIIGVRPLADASTAPDMQAAFGL